MSDADAQEQVPPSRDPEAELREMEKVGRRSALRKHSCAEDPPHEFRRSRNGILANVLFFFSDKEEEAVRRFRSRVARQVEFDLLDQGDAIVAGDQVVKDPRTTYALERGANLR